MAIDIGSSYVCNRLLPVDTGHIGAIQLRIRLFKKEGKISTAVITTQCSQHRAAAGFTPIGLDEPYWVIISEDPIGFEGGINLFRYVRSNPINLFDPGGLTEADVSIIMNNISMLFPEIKPRGEVIFGQPVEGNVADTDPFTADITIPSRYKRDELSRDEFVDLYWTLFHEAMHSTDPLITRLKDSAYDTWHKKVLKDDKISMHHQSIENRERYERRLKKYRNLPKWGNPAGTSPADPGRLYDQTREQRNQVRCGSK